MLLGVALALAGCGSSGPAMTRDDRHSRDVFELAATFEGKAATLLGSSREWYSPGTGFYDVERRFRGKRATAVYNGSTISHRVHAAVFRWRLDGRQGIGGYELMVRVEPPVAA